jgi:hypothetical protein
MTKYRIKEYQGKFTVEIREFEEIQRGQMREKWVKWKSIIGDTIKYDTLQEAKEAIDDDIMFSKEPKYHYYPEETK